MQYMGGKHYSAKKIALVLEPYLALGGDFYEPFCGALHATLAINPYVRGSVYLSDGFKDLVDLWVAVRDGFSMPAITKSEYTELRNAEASPIRTAAGFGLSFSGIWFGSFVEDRPQYSKYPLQALNRSFDKRRDLLRKVRISHCDYSEIQPKRGDVVYCDPPYLGTAPYAGLPLFDHDRFWSWVRKTSSEGVHVFVSEYSAPEDFVHIWEQKLTSRIKTSVNRSGTTHFAVERLWTRPPT